MKYLVLFITGTYPLIIYASQPNVHLFDAISNASFLNTVLISIAMASGAGFARTAQLLKNPNNKVPNIKNRIIADQIASIFAGLIAYLVVQREALDTIESLLIILGCGYLGSSLLDVAEKISLEGIKHYIRKWLFNDKSD